MKPPRSDEHLDEDLRQALALEGADALDLAILERLARGNLADDERRALDARCEQDPLLKQAMAAHAPLGPAFEARIADRILAQTRPRPAEVAIPFWRRWRNWLAGGLTLSLATAGILLAVQRRPEVPGLPVYSTELSLGFAELRSAGTNRPQGGPVAPDAPFRLLLRPESDVQGPIRVLGFVEQNGRMDPVALPHRVSAHGAVEVQGRLADIVGTRRGVMRLWVMLGAGPLDARDAAGWTKKDQRPADVQAVGVDLVVASAP